MNVVSFTPAVPISAQPPVPVVERSTWYSASFVAASVHARSICVANRAVAVRLVGVAGTVAGGTGGP
jgi:hypothetical protein